MRRHPRCFVWGHTRHGQSTVGRHVTSDLATTERLLDVLLLVFKQAATKTGKKSRIISVSRLTTTFYMRFQHRCCHAVRFWLDDWVGFNVPPNTGHTGTSKRSDFVRNVDIHSSSTHVKLLTLTHVRLSLLYLSVLPYSIDAIYSADATICSAVYPIIWRLWHPETATDWTEKTSADNKAVNPGLNNDSSLKCPNLP